MTLSRKFMIDTLTVWYGLEQLAEMTDREVYELYCERMGHDVMLNSETTLAKLAACEELLGCVENGTDVYRPDVELDGILITRELVARIQSHLAQIG
jgi:hypothetical protein